MKIIYLALVFAAANALPKKGFVPLRDIARPPRIIDGLLANEGQFPWQVSNRFTVPGQGRFFCGGSLISECWVLTAGHCAQNAIDVEITLGTIYSDHSDPNEVVSYDNLAIAHENYDPLYAGDDVAVIRLSECVTFTDKIQPIMMADSFIDADLPVIASGWGRTEYSTGAVRDLGYADLTTVTNVYCQRVYLELPTYIGDKILCCVGADRESTCSGDSGGPLVQQLSDGSYVHVGVISFVGNIECDTHFPSGYMRTASYRDWIYGKTGL